MSSREIADFFSELIRMNIHKGDLPRAENIAVNAIEHLKLLDPNVIKSLSQHQIQENRIDEALSLAHKLHSAHSMHSSSNIYSNIVFQMLQNNDIQKALQVFLQIGKKYRLTPASYIIMKRLIIEKEFNELNDVMDILIQVHGRNNALIQCAEAFIETANVEQASNIFEELKQINGGHSLPFIQHRIDFYYEKSNIDFLEKLLIATSTSISASDRKYLYDKIIMDLCRRKANINDIVSKCTLMIKENLKPSPIAFEILKNYLKKNNTGVPAKWSTDEDGMPGKSNKEDELEKALKENRLEDARVIFFESLDSKEQILRRILRFFLTKSAQAGEVATFNNLREHFDEWTRQQTDFYKYEVIAHTANNSGIEIIQKWKRTFTESDAKDFKILVQAFPRQFFELLVNEHHLIRECN